MFSEGRQVQIRNRRACSPIVINMYLSWIKKENEEARVYRWVYWAIDSLKHCSISIQRFYRVWARIMRHEMAVLVSSTHLAKVKASSTSTKLPLKRSRETRTTNDPLCTRSLRSTTLPSIPITYSVFSCDHFLSLSLFRGRSYFDLQFLTIFDLLWSRFLSIYLFIFLSNDFFLFCDINNGKITENRNFLRNINRSFMIYDLNRKNFEFRIDRIELKIQFVLIWIFKCFLNMYIYVIDRVILT